MSKKSDFRKLLLDLLNILEGFYLCETNSPNKTSLAQRGAATVLKIERIFEEMIEQ